MTKLVVVSREGAEQSIEAKDGVTVMEALRDAGNDELLALCGGCCSCATCHIYVEGGFFEKLVAASEDENDLLDSTSSRKEHSRLACQVPVKPELDGMRVVIAPDD